MSVAGIALSTYEPGLFSKVPAHMSRQPQRSFDLGKRLGELVVEWVRGRYGDDGTVDLAKVTHSLPMAVYRHLSLDELCKVRFSSRLMMAQSVEDAFKAEPRLTIYHKITSSMWRWGCGRAGWNEIVDVYEGIRRFDLGHLDLDVRFDHSTSVNKCGLSEYSRTFLDGVFGFLVHYRGEHVMTLGFSVMDGHRLLIQQVQLKSRRGNRWLFKLPRNYLEHVIDRFRLAFPRHRVFIVDGSDAIGKSLTAYRNGLAGAERRVAEAEGRLAKASAENAPYYRRDIEHGLEQAAEMQTSISHLEPEVARIAAFYEDTGRYRQGRVVKVNGLRHYEIEAA